MSYGPGLRGAQRLPGSLRGAHLGGAAASRADRGGVLAPIDPDSVRLHLARLVVFGRADAGDAAALGVRARRSTHSWPTCSPRTDRRRDAQRRVSSARTGGIEATEDGLGERARAGDADAFGELIAAPPPGRASGRHRRARDGRRRRRRRAAGDRTGVASVGELPGRPAVRALAPPASSRTARATTGAREGRRAELAVRALRLQRERRLTRGRSHRGRGPAARRRRDQPALERGPPGDRAPPLRVDE